MVWLNSSTNEKQKYLELRLNAPKGERILLDLILLKLLILPIGKQSGKIGTAIIIH